MGVSQKSWFIWFISWKIPSFDSWMMISGYLPTKTFTVRALENGRTYTARLDHGDLPIKEKRCWDHIDRHRNPNPITQ